MVRNHPYGENLRFRSANATCYNGGLRGPLWGWGALGVPFGVGGQDPRNAVAHNLAKAISDCGWGMFTNFLAYKLERKGGKLVEIDRWFPSSKLCSNCFYQMSEMSLDVREWTCPHCGSHHDRDGNAATNIRAEGIRMRACGWFSRLVL